MPTPVGIGLVPTAPPAPRRSTASSAVVSRGSSTWAIGAGGAAGTNPIPTGVGIVTCADGATRITTDPVPYSMAGDADVDARITLPATCLAPNVFFAGVTGAGPRWFAVNGG